MRTAVLLASIAVLLAAAEGKDDVQKELKKFEGDWVLASGEKEGTKIADEHVKKSKITWKGKVTTLLTPHQSKEPIKGECTIDLTKTPSRSSGSALSGRTKAR